MRRSLAAAIGVLWLGCGLFAQNGGLTPIQLSSIGQVLQVLPHPDGSSVAFVRLEPRMGDEEPGRNHTSLWIMPADGQPGDERLLIPASQGVRGAAFSPDGSMICFLQRGEGTPHTEIWGLPLAGGMPRRVTRTPHGVSSYAWSPSGHAIAFTATDPLPKARAAARALGFRQRVVDEDRPHRSLWVWNVKEKSCKRLSSDVTVNSFEWAPDGKSLAVGVAPTPSVDDRYVGTKLARVEVASGERSPLVDNPGKLGGYAWSPDGSRFAYISAADRRDPHAGMLYLLEGGKIRALTPSYEGMVHHIEWVDTKRLGMIVSEGVKTFVDVLDVSNGERERLGGGGGFAFHDGARHRFRWYLVASSSKRPAEVVVLERKTFRTMTDTNPWLRKVRLANQTTERFKARDGLEIEGLLIHPLAAHDGPTPLVILAHGGPESHHSEGWLSRYSTWGQVLAARGYAVWFPNYRASTGRGVKFAKADHGDPMGREFEDHLDAIAYFAKRGLIDPKRVGIGGGSYGGYTAAWAATRHSEHFACAVSFVPFVDIRTKWLCSDIPNEFHRVHYEEMWPHEQRAFLSERSPLSYAQDCGTPLLLLGGTDDPRVHPSQPFMLYRAVKFATKTPVRYVQYPGEGHGNAINVYRYDYLVRTLRWFEHYLGDGGRRDRPLPPLDVDYGPWGK